MSNDDRTRFPVVKSSEFSRIGSDSWSGEVKVHVDAKLLLLWKLGTEEKVGCSVGAGAVETEDVCTPMSFSTS